MYSLTHNPIEKKRKRRASTSAAVTDTDETSHNPGEETRQLLAKIQKGKHVYLVVEVSLLQNA